MRCSRPLRNRIPKSMEALDSIAGMKDWQKAYFGDQVIKVLR